MDLKLTKFIENLSSLCSVNSLDINNSVVVRLNNVIASLQTVVAVSVLEPSNVVLPLNVLWLNSDPTSSFYKKLLRRVSKIPDTHFLNTWIEVVSYSSVEDEQYYDDFDSAIISTQNTVANASSLVKGLVKLSVPPSNPTNPIAVGEGDPRLTDARIPLHHTHPLQPAAALKTATNIVTINTSTQPVAGQVLVAISATEAHWVTL